MSTSCPNHVSFLSNYCPLPVLFPSSSCTLPVLFLSTSCLNHVIFLSNCRPLPVRTTEGFFLIKWFIKGIFHSKMKLSIHLFLLVRACGMSSVWCPHVLNICSVNRMTCVISVNVWVSFCAVSKTTNQRQSNHKVLTSAETLNHVGRYHRHTGKTAAEHTHSHQSE